MKESNVTTFDCQMLDFSRLRKTTKSKVYFAKLGSMSLWCNYMVKSYFWAKLSSLKNTTNENIKHQRKHEKHGDRLFNKGQHLSRKMSKNIGK